MGIQRNAVEAFKAWAVTYDETVSKELERFLGITHQDVLDRLLQLAHFEEGGSVLDVGTGTGWAAIRSAFEMEEGTVVGIDVTPEMLAQSVNNAQRAGVNGRLQYTLGTAMNLPYPDDHFDVVMSSLALHHTVVTQSLDEMMRVLKPGGRVALADMGAPPAWRSAPISWLMKLFVQIYKLAGSARARADAEAFQETYTAEEWRHLLAEKGLENPQVRALLRPGQRVYPCLILVSGQKRMAEASPAEARESVQIGALAPRPHLEASAS